MMPALKFDESFQRDGVPGLFSPRGYQIGWTEYQSHIMEKLNKLTAGEPFQHHDPKTLALIFARDPMNAALFNYASMAWNNNYYYGSMAPAPRPIEYNPLLQDSLIKTFGSMETLRSTMINTAESMFGPGFVWLVWTKGEDRVARKGQWRILNTYLAGTPFPEAGYRAQGVDMNTSNPHSYEAYMQQQAGIPGNTAGYIGSHSPQAKATRKMPPGGTSLMPVLCVNTWEHVYIYDYGVKGKSDYLEKWWDAIDWAIVQERANSDAQIENPLSSPTKI